jgi:formylglycine-generating enzyme required for sulfatase activity
MEFKTLQDYEIIKKLGKGSFSEVYLAEHKFLKKRYVLKVLSKELIQDEKFISNFENHINILTKLDHPSIVKIHNISKTDDLYFLVMEAMVDSSNEVISLQRFLNLRGNILAEIEMETILRQLASALDYAHKMKFANKNLFHGSLKFENIFVKQTERGLKVYISDFGFSSLIGEGKVLFKSQQNLITEMSLNENIDPNLKIETTYKFLNSFSFLAPEQKFKSLNDEINIKTDIYSFGILAYYLIAREFPNGYFDLPSKIAPEYKLNWDLLICKCLQKDQSRRPTYLIESLNSFLSKEESDISSLEVLSWEEVEKKVENAMQMSFEFSNDFNKLDIIENDTSEKNDNEIKFTSIEENNQKPIINPQNVERPTYELDPGAIFNKELNVSYYQPKKVEFKEVNPLQSEMVIIPKGDYFRGSEDGSRDEKPRHKIILSSFALDIHPVTNEQFVRFLEFMGGEKDSNNNDIIRLRSSRIKRSNGKITIESGYSKHPVVGITWYGAQSYAKWVGKRLPKEAEWEIASRAGAVDLTYPTGKNIDHTQANFFNSDTTAVMSYPPNEYGIYDIVGNVYEWCEDWYAYNYYDTSLQEPEDPKGPPQGVYRVLRGGCWKSLKEDLRCAHRHRNNPGALNGTYGFRCAAYVS